MGDVDYWHDGFPTLKEITHPVKAAQTIRGFCLRVSHFTLNILKFSYWMVIQFLNIHATIFSRKVPKECNSVRHWTANEPRSSSQGVP